MIERLKSRVLYCRRLKPDDAGYVEDFELYHTPEPRWINLRDMSGEAMLAAAGELLVKTVVGKDLIKSHIYEENSRCYIGKLPAEPFDPLAEDANYTIRRVSITHDVSEIIFQRLVASEV